VTSPGSNTTDPPNLCPSGYRIVRRLAARADSIVHLAQNPETRWVALKHSRLSTSTSPAEALIRHQRLKELTTGSGLVPILDCGLSTDLQWLWESLTLADNLDRSPESARDPMVGTGQAGCPEFTGEASVAGYLPATLDLRVNLFGPLSTRETARLGATVCGTLSRLHAEDLVHRDVKPTNLFLINKQVHLGDFGLASAPGQPFDFRGTEGFLPVAGGSGKSADLFALGKTLYELWTGSDRLEFPNLPRSVTASKDWRSDGKRLHALLLQLCGHRSDAGFTSADQLQKELLAIADGIQPPRSRRRCVVPAIIAAGTAVVALLLLRPPPVRIPLAPPENYDFRLGTLENWTVVEWPENIQLKPSKNATGGYLLRIEEWERGAAIAMPKFTVTDTTRTPSREVCSNRTIELSPKPIGFRRKNTRGPRNR
jgi:serine/threonine protein kinase